RIAIAQAGLCGIAEAGPALAELVRAPGPTQLDAAKAIVKLRVDQPAVTDALLHIACSEALAPEIRVDASEALARLPGVAGAMRLHCPRLRRSRTSPPMNRSPSARSPKSGRRTCRTIRSSRWPSC